MIGVRESVKEEGKLECDSQDLGLRTNWTTMSYISIQEKMAEFLTCLTRDVYGYQNRNVQLHLDRAKSQGTI